MAKCPICGTNKSNKKDLLEHIENKHKNEIPQSMSTAQYVYSLNHDGRAYGICRICGEPTPWNEKTGKPKQICVSKSCKERVAKEFEANLKSKLNMTRQDLMNNPDHQEQMLANRKISGTYKWSDGKHAFIYTGTYEKFALEWLDKIMDIDPDTVQTPGPKIQYMFEGKPHYWITDMYLSEYNLVVEIKDGNATGEKNTHPGFAHNRALEKAKDDYMKTQNQYNYLKLTNKNMMQLVKILSEIRLNNIFSNDKGTKKEEPFININESTENVESLNESMNDISPGVCASDLIRQIAHKVNCENWTRSTASTYPLHFHVGWDLFGNIVTENPIPVEVFKELGYSNFRNLCRSSSMINFTCSKIVEDINIELTYNWMNKENNIKIYPTNVENSINECIEFLELNESAKNKPRVNDEGKKVPENCPKCGSKIGIFFKGEPVFLCTNKDCNKYYGTLPFNESIDIDYESLIDMDPLTEVVAIEKGVGEVKNLYLKIVSYIKDITRKWQNIQEVNVSKEEKESIEKVLNLSKKLSSNIREILETQKSIHYETDYESFLGEINKFNKARKNKDKTETINISTLQSHIRHIEKEYNETAKLNTDSKFNKKYKTALYIVLSRTLYVINLALYNTSGKGMVGTMRSDKNAGIISKRYGSSEMKVNISKLKGNSSKELLIKLRNSSSFSAYKKIFDDIVELYKRTNVSALKFLDLEHHDKLVFLSYNKLKPMILKKGTKLYHFSGCKNIDTLKPVYKCRDNITFYSTPRVYLTDKLMDPKKVLPNLKDVFVYEYECPRDMTAYRDNEYGSWFHHCIYIETEKPLKVKNITDEVIADSSKNEWIDYDSENELLILNEDTSVFDDVIDETKSSDENLEELENKLSEVYKKYKKMNADEKKKKLIKVFEVCQKTLNIISHVSGIGFIATGLSDLKSTKAFMRDLKTEMPMNHETYNHIKIKLKVAAILKILLGLLITAGNIIIINKITGKGISKACVSIINNIGKIANRTDNKVINDICAKISNLATKLFNINIIHENIELYDIVDISETVEDPILLSNDDINALCEGTYEYKEENDIDILNEAAFPFFMNNNLIDKLSNKLFKKNDVKMPNAAYSTYDIKNDTWKNILFPKNDFTKKIASIFHRVEINEKNHTIEIRGINYAKLIQHIKDLYPDQKVYKIFEIIYNPKDWDKYKNKRITKKDVRVEYVQTYEFFALELSILFKELYEEYNLSYYNDICIELYNKTWLSHSDIVKPENIDMNALKLLNDKYELKLYQKEFIELYPILKSKLNLNGYILSFDQGLGKTLTSVALALCLKKERVYIVCPNTLKENWALEIKSYFPKYSNEDIWKEEVFINGISKSFDLKKAKFIIVNQESISKIFDKVDKKTNNMLVIDESHNFRNLNSARSLDLIKLRDMIETKDTLVMSGTPIKASPNEICPVMRLIDPLFTDEVANVYNKCFNMNDIVASNLIQTRFGKVMYRKTKAEVLQLPEKKIDTLKLKVSNPEKYLVKNVRQLVKERAKELYKTEYKDYDSMQQEFHDLINKYSKSSKEDMAKYLHIIDENIPNYELHEMDVLFKQNYLSTYVDPYISGKDKERLEYLLVRFVNMWQHCVGVALGEIMHPRRKELFIKLYEDNKGIITNMIFDNVKKTVIFTPLVDVANHIHKSLEEAGLSSVLVTGQVKDKLTPILRFKEDSKIDVLVATSQTLGTGVTLTEANLMFFFGTPWRSTDFDQCCDRIYRIGQTNDVFIFKVLMDSEELNLSTRMEDILNWSNQMFDAMITSTDDPNIEGLNENSNESVMSVANLSPIITNGFYEELNPNKTNEDFDEQLESLKKTLTESLEGKIEPKDFCPETLSDNDTPDSQLMNRVKSDIINNVATEVFVDKHYGALYASSDFHIFGVWNKDDNNVNATNIQQVNAIIDNINNRVGEDDTFIICGDLGYKLDDCLYQHTKYFLSAIKCKHIWLVVGNHDLLTNEQYKELGCEIVCDRLNYNGWIFTHYPVNSKYNFHGHLHIEKIDGKYDDMNSNLHWNVFYWTNGIIKVKDITDLFTNEEQDDDNPLIENSLKDSDVMFGNGEYSAITDRKFTDFQTGVENEDVDPYSSMFSPNHTKDIKDYMDASNNFETNEDVRIDVQIDPASGSSNDIASIAQSIYNSNFQ